MRSNVSLERVPMRVWNAFQCEFGTRSNVPIGTRSNRNWNAFQSNLPQNAFQLERVPIEFAVERVPIGTRSTPISIGTRSNWNFGTRSKLTLEHDELQIHINSQMIEKPFKKTKIHKYLKKSTKKRKTACKDAQKCKYKTD